MQTLPFRAGRVGNPECRAGPQHALEGPGCRLVLGLRDDCVEAPLTLSLRSGLPYVVPSSSSRWLSLVACLVVVAMFLGVNLEHHTDDGCPIEIHCTVCRVHMAGLATPIAVPALAPVWSVDVAPSDARPIVGDAAAPSTLALRGPPAA